MECGVEEKSVFEWKGLGSEEWEQRVCFCTTRLPAVHRETEAEKLEILVEIVKENIDFLVGCWTARILNYLQKEGEKGMKEEQWTSALLEGNRMRSFIDVGSSRRKKNL